MKKMIRFIFIFLAVFSFAFSAFSAEKLNVSGSTTVLPIMQIIAEEFMNQNPEVDITVSGGGSGVGIAALIDKIANVAMSSRKIKAEELDKAVAKGLSVQEFEIAKDAITVIVSPANTMMNQIDSHTLKQIYTGAITNWKDLNGEDKPIVVISRDTNSGTFEVFNEHILKKDQLAPTVLMLASNRAILDEVGNNPEAIGYVGLGYVTDQVKGLLLDGVEPTKENALNGSYSISRGLYLYTPDIPQGVTKDFIDYFFSEEGQTIVEEEGFIRIK
ncbi:phosphate ABC transporter substrate-binding protein [Atribacter laminatus]|uniref:Phosphate-binding protein n=1 Tax=Atribacter laminatus TaxID=2847778 RepID=A0A7T1AJ37_ATRLM|nr:phosphate ABC transporter substrate-binding protein [Atribacter laminatus]QPM66858.1 Phosphate-binding protein PstS [Atribacter laminatus]